MLWAVKWQKRGAKTLKSLPTGSQFPFSSDYQPARWEIIFLYSTYDAISFNAIVCPFSLLHFYFFNIFIVFPSLASVHAVESGNPLEDIIQPIRQGNSRVESRKKRHRRRVGWRARRRRGEKRSKFRWCRGGNKKTEKGKTMKEWGRWMRKNEEK